MPSSGGGGGGGAALSVSIAIVEGLAQLCEVAVLRRFGGGPGGDDGAWVVGLGASTCADVS